MVKPATRDMLCAAALRLARIRPHATTGEASELVRLREWLTSAWDGRGMTLREELDNRIAALAARNPEARQ